MSRKLNVKWNHRCAACKAPTDILVEYIDDERMIRDIASWATHRPIDLMYNLSMFKTKGGKAYRYCWACYTHDPTLTIKELHSREIGKSIKRNTPRSRSERELEEWFRGLYNYMNRSDVDECTIKSVKTYWPLGLMIYMSFS